MLSWRLRAMSYDQAHLNLLFCDHLGMPLTPVATLGSVPLNGGPAACANSSRDSAPRRRVVNTSPVFVGPMARSVLVAEDPEAGRHPEVCGCVPAVVSKYR